MRSRFESLEEDLEDDSSEETSAEKVYMANVIREIVKNGSTADCSGNNEAHSLQDEEIEKITDAIYALSGLFYFVSKKKVVHSKREKNQ